MASRKQVTYSERPNHAARRAHAQGERAFRTYDTSFIRPKRSKAPAIISLVVLVVVLALIIFGIASLVRGCSPQTNLIGSGETATITVAEGEGAGAIGKSLASAGLVSDASKFTNRVAELGKSSSLKTGTYTIAGGTSIDDIIGILEAGVSGETFTVPEGSTLKQTAAIVSKATNGRISENDFIQAASNASVYAGSYSFLASAGTHSLEGFLFPKTYTFDDASTADSIIRAMLDQFKIETASLDLSYATSKGLSLYDVVNLASIVEKEADADHRTTVASVFYNRLADKMRLQSDATVAYFVGHDPTADDVATENEYNTYFIDGLPPTPINSPGLATLQAVCAPETTKYLYFYFAPDDKGVMQYYFSETYEEHRATFE